MPTPSTGSAARSKCSQDAQRDQRRDALAVGRDLVQRVAAVVLPIGSTHSGW